MWKAKKSEKNKGIYINDLVLTINNVEKCRKRCGHCISRVKFVAVVQSTPLGYLRLRKSVRQGRTKLGGAASHVRRIDWFVRGNVYGILRWGRDGGWRGLAWMTQTGRYVATDGTANAILHHLRDLLQWRRRQPIIIFAPRHLQNSREITTKVSVALCSSASFTTRLH